MVRRWRPGHGARPAQGGEIGRNPVACRRVCAYRLPPSSAAPAPSSAAPVLQQACKSALPDKRFVNSGGRKIPRRRRNSAWYELTGDRAFWLFVLFAIVVFLAGGGSRYDIDSNGPLRFVAAIVLAIALVFQTGKSLRRIALPLTVLLLLGLWMVIQLIPLPPSLWAGLPGRDTIAELGQLAGIADVWRPITFSPLKTANSLASLVVPLAVLMVLSQLDDRGWRRLPLVLIFAGVASALLGIAQIILPGSPGLYLYEITNRESAVGLFSNRNHNAIFLDIALLFAAIRIDRVDIRKLNAIDLVPVVAAPIIFAGLLVNGSRAGLVGLGAVGVIYTVRALVRWYASRGQGGGGTARLAVSLAIGAISVSLLGIFALLGRSPAVERLVAQDAADDQRFEALPTVLSMACNNLPFGVGFGAFEQAFYTVEPESTLRPAYLNNAHDDWLQFVVEGGLPAVCLGLFVLGAVGWRVFRMVSGGASDKAMQANAWLGFFALLLIALGSLVDYPLRTPAMMLVAAVAAAMLFKPIAARRT